MEHALAPGTELQSSTNTYIIRSVLGSGGFGITYKATFNGYLNGLPIQAVVAIKEYFISADCERNESTRSVSYSAPARSRVEGSRKDFVGEARRLQSVGRGHRNIVQVSEVFDANNTSYYMMEYLEGESLSDYVRSHGPLSETETLLIMRPIIEAVGYLHQNRITHLDIKPANIMLAKDYNGDVRPVLIDFGLSKHYNEDGSATSTINTRGFSDGYAPVEQYIGLSTFSPASDVYSLSATIMYCLTGCSLPRANELTTQKVESLIPNAVSSSLRKALIQSLNININERPADGNTLSAMLGEANNTAKPEPTPKGDKTERIIDPEFPNTEKTESYSGANNAGNGHPYSSPVQKNNITVYPEHVHTSKSSRPKRSGFVTFWLYLCLAGSIWWVIGGKYVLDIFLDYHLENIYILRCFLAIAIWIANVIGCIILLNHRKYGFWIIFIAIAVDLILPMFAGTQHHIDMYYALYRETFGIFEKPTLLHYSYSLSNKFFITCEVGYLMLLYIVLQIKKNGISYWRQLK